MQIVVTVAVMLVLEVVTPLEAEEDAELDATLVVEAVTFVVEVELEAGEEVEVLEAEVVDKIGTQPGMVKVPLPALPDAPYTIQL